MICFHDFNVSIFNDVLQELLHFSSEASCCSCHTLLQRILVKVLKRKVRNFFLK